MLTFLALTMLVSGDPAARIPPATAREMTDVLVAVNKALGLESWTLAGVEPCVDRGGLEGTIKDVSAESTQECAASAVTKGFPGLGEAYVLGIPMAGIGPVTVFAIGRGDAAGWGAYSCDPKRKCPPTKLASTSKQAKRLADRYQRACADEKTVWLPSREGVCEDSNSHVTSSAIPQSAGEK